MRYIQPEITGTFDAVSSIHGVKGGVVQEGTSQDFTEGAAYPADE